MSAVNPIQIVSNTDSQHFDVLTMFPCGRIKGDLLRVQCQRGEGISAAARSGTKRSWRDYWTEGTIKKIFHDRNVTDIWRARDVVQEWSGSGGAHRPSVIFRNKEEEGRRDAKAPPPYSLITFIDVLGEMRI